MAPPRRTFRGYLAASKCQYCRRPLDPSNARTARAKTRDHAVPRSAGGFRIVAACSQCNTLKANLPYDVWEEFMWKHPDWWLDPRFRWGKSLTGKPLAAIALACWLVPGIRARVGPPPDHLFVAAGMAPAKPDLSDR